LANFWLQFPPTKRGREVTFHACGSAPMPATQAIQHLYLKQAKPYNSSPIMLSQVWNISGNLDYNQLSEGKS
jgi:hypothetical protein